MTSTATLRLDDRLRERIARLADATDATPHAFMVQALTEKVDEAEWKLAFQLEAKERHAAWVAGEPAIEWHEMKTWLRDKAKQAPKPRKRA